MLRLALLTFIGVLAQGTTPQGTTPSACAAEVRAYATQRQIDMRAALPQLPQNPGPELLAEYQARLSQLSGETTRNRTAMAKACAAKFDAKTVASSGARACTASAGSSLRSRSATGSGRPRRTRAT